MRNATSSILLRFKCGLIDTSSPRVLDLLLPVDHGACLRLLGTASSQNLYLMRSLPVHNWINFIYLGEFAIDNCGLDRAWDSTLDLWIDHLDNLHAYGYNSRAELFEEFLYPGSLLHLAWRANNDLLRHLLGSGASRTGTRFRANRERDKLEYDWICLLYVWRYRLSLTSYERSWETRAISQARHYRPYHSVHYLHHLCLHLLLWMGQRPRLVCRNWDATSR